MICACTVAYILGVASPSQRFCTGAGVAVTVRTYWAWESTATLHLLSGSRGAGAPTGDDRGGVYRVARRTVYCKPAGSTSAMHVTFDEIQRT